MTQRNREIVERYERETATTLWEVYGRYSQAKANAYDYCRRLQYEKGGHGLRILGANCFMFTAAFRYEVDGVPYLMYITKNADTPIRLED